MASPRAPRFDPLEFAQPPQDEELPDYEPNTAPEYDREDFERPLCTYHLRQKDRKSQILVWYGPSTSASYKFVTRGTRLFSKKAEIEMQRAQHGQTNYESIGAIWFDNDGPLPWRPRAHFHHTDTKGLSTHPMESRNFTDWTVMIDGITYSWNLESRPMSIALCEKTSKVVIARFIFSARGTQASDGARVGELVIYPNGLSADQDGVEKIMCSMAVVLNHFRKMGKFYRNAENETMAQVESLTREHISMRQASVVTTASEPPPRALVTLWERSG